MFDIIVRRSLEQRLLVLLAALPLMVNQLAALIAKLPEREQLVLSLYYEQELNLKEIGAVLGVSESRVCQIHGQAVLRLRGRLKIFEAADAGLES